MAEITEKDRRVYYQDLVYRVCNRIDLFDGQPPGRGIVCGTADSPSAELISRLEVLLGEMKQLRNERHRLRLAAVAFLQKMDEVELIHPALGDQTDRVFGRFESEDLRSALEDLGDTPEPSQLELKTALAESLSLQSHYADSLNRWDGGRRRTFSTPESWIDRLREIGMLPTPAADV
jgi:hypothetical protein